MILHIERNEFIYVHYHLLVILLLFDSRGVLIVFWRWNRWHHILVIKHVVFVSLFFIKTNQILLMIAYPRSLNAGCGLLEGTGAIFNKVLFDWLSFLDIHAASKISHSLRHLRASAYSLKQITSRVEPLLWNYVPQVGFWTVGSNSATTSLWTGWWDSLGKLWTLK